MLHIHSLTYFRNTVSKIMKVIVNTFLISLEMQQTSLVHQSALQPKVHEPRVGFNFFLIVQPVSCHHLLRSHQKEINVSGIGQTSTAHKPNELLLFFKSSPHSLLKYTFPFFFFFLGHLLQYLDHVRNAQVLLKTLTGKYCFQVIAAMLSSSKVNINQLDT